MTTVPKMRTFNKVLRVDEVVLDFAEAVREFGKAPAGSGSVSASAASERETATQ
jgi:hypothetical protein